MKSPKEIIKYRYVTEKARMLESLQHATNNPSVQKCDNPKFVFVVDRYANKHEIAKAVEELYADKKIKVIAVNTTIRKPKKRRVRGRQGRTSYLKKAVVTLQAGDSIDEQV
jgi:large subunit ribosomal protein L23